MTQINKRAAKKRAAPRFVELTREGLPKGFLAPLAMGMAKHIINTCQSADLETGRILERFGQSVLNGTEDQKEGTAAFLEKRPPRFHGR